MADQTTKPDSAPAFYFCPGESHPISPAIHYARLAAFYPKCRTCALRHHTGHLPPETVQLDVRKAVTRETLVTEAGLRGVYLNEINRFHAAALTNAYVILLMQGAFSPRPTGQPTIIVGYQEHPSAPDLMIGVVNALRATGVTIVDLGLTVATEVSYAIRQLSAAGGLLVTGAGEDPSWIGFDFLTSAGTAIQDRDSLIQIETAKTLPTFRLPQANGSYRTWDVQAEYEGALSGLFHALRPLRIGFASSLRRVNEMVTRLFEPLPCSLDLLPLPHRKRDLTSSEDSDVIKLGDLVTSRALHLGILVEADGRRCALVNDEGQLVPLEQWRTWLQEGSAIEPFLSQSSLGMTDDDALFETDAVLTLALVLSEMSRSDAQLSERLWVG
ncbi:MAG: hypothetical protein HUJ26_05675 [Planctomycetaceae bacterium]|nr:hypothetical protein [Planctomycetaceae bacterium]